MAFTPAQEAAIHALNRELLVSAAAGSGKTRVLVERIVWLLTEQGLSVDRLLVVTFTHAAAAEMRERLQLLLTEAATDNRALRHQAELLDTAQISTLHSFCQTLVRNYFQAVEVDPQSTLGDESQCAPLLSDARAEALEWLYEQAASGDADCATLTAKFEDAAIDRMLSELYPFLLSLPDPFGWFTQQGEKQYSPEDLQRGPLAETLLADCRLQLDGLQALVAACEALAQNPLCPAAYAQSIRADGQAVEALCAVLPQGLQATAAQARGFSLTRLPTVRNLVGEEAELRDAYKALRERIKKGAAAVGQRLPADPEPALARLNAMQPALRALGRTAQEMDARYAARKRERTLMDFHDLERFALRILAQPAIREEVAARYDGVFVDEYQDISGVQEAILNAVKRDVSRETIGSPQRVFYVGDVKQSIYRFRQADPTLFMDKARAFGAEADAPCRRITLNANFRSREAVLAGVNRVFEQVMRADVTEIDYDAEARLYPGLPSRGDPPVSLHLFAQPVRAADRARLQAYAIGMEIRRRVGQPTLDRDGNPGPALSYRDFAILSPKMKDVSAVLERVFGELGIPLYCEDRRSALHSEEIAQALNHLRLLDNLADDLSLIACLKSPAVGLDERELTAIRLRTPEGSYLDALRAEADAPGPLGRRCAAALAMLAQERFLAREMPLDRYLWGWLHRSGLYAFYGCQPNGQLRQANLRMLCQKAGDHVRQRGGDLRDFLNTVEARADVRDGGSPTVLSPWEDVVRAMTIHKSKGLEFPVVFVMGLEQPFSQKRGGAPARHARLGVALPYVNEQTRTTGATLLQSAIELRAQAEERAERARLLYVAMTRAREELILLGCGNAVHPEDAADGFTRMRGGTAYAVFSAGSMLDWLCQCLDARDSVSIAEPAVSDSEGWITPSQEGFSTQSTDNPQKTGGWNVVFHIDPAEVAAAQRYARGQKELSALDKRRARLAALAQEARALAHTLRLEPQAEPPEGSNQGLAAREQGATVQTTPALFTHAPFQPAASDAATGAEHTQVGVTPAPTGWGTPAQGVDPLAPPLRFVSTPYKVGATALVRAEQEAAAGVLLAAEADVDPAEAEPTECKRLPLPLTRPRRMADLPDLPAFLQPPPEQTGLRRGVATHRVLSLLPFATLRPVADESAALRAAVQAQLEAMVAHRQLTAEEAALVDTQAVLRFLQSPWGREALTADTVRREWSFNLRLPERDGLLVQGVIDLCTLRQGQWTLVDYKTDAVPDAEALWPLYGAQIDLYRRALREATGMPVRSATLYALALGEGATRS